MAAVYAVFTLGKRGKMGNAPFIHSVYHLGLILVFKTKRDSSVVASSKLPAISPSEYLFSNRSRMPASAKKKEEHTAELHAYERTMMIADKQYIGLLSRSLAAIESAKSEEARQLAA